MGQTIQIRRGNENNLPTLASGELGLTLDTKKLFAGTPEGNVEVATMANYVKNPGFSETTNTENDYAATLSPSPTAYVDGMGVTVKINADSTGEATLNVNELGAKPIVDSTGKAVKNLKANGIYTVRYNASTGNFILQGEGGDPSKLITAVNSMLDA